MSQVSSEIVSQDPDHLGGTFVKKADHLQAETSNNRSGRSNSSSSHSSNQLCLLPLTVNSSLIHL